MRVSTDDQIYRVKGHWIDLRGTPMPGPYTYTQWWVGVLCGLAAWVVLHLFGKPVAVLTLGLIDGWTQPVVAVLIGIAASRFITSRIDGERSLRQWAGLVRKARATRKAHRKTLKARKPRRYLLK